MGVESRDNFFGNFLHIWVMKLRKLYSTHCQQLKTLKPSTLM